MDSPSITRVVPALLAWALAWAAMAGLEGRLDLANLAMLFDRLVIASGDSNRQVKALTRNDQEKVREAGAEVLSVEGEESGEWVLVDLGDIIVHVMQPTVRQYSNLEELWQATPAQRRKAVEQAAGE